MRSLVRARAPAHGPGGRRDRARRRVCTPGRASRRTPGPASPGGRRDRAGHVRGADGALPRPGRLPLRRADQRAAVHGHAGRRRPRLPTDGQRAGVPRTPIARGHSRRRIRAGAGLSGHAAAGDQRPVQQHDAGPRRAGVLHGRPHHRVGDRGGGLGSDHGPGDGGRGRHRHLARLDGLPGAHRHRRDLRLPVPGAGVLPTDGFRRTGTGTTRPTRWSHRAPGSTR